MKELENLRYGRLFKEPQLRDLLGATFDQLLKEGALEHFQKDLYFRTKKTRFGARRASDGDVLNFIFENYPQSFMGSHYAYNNLGFSTQVPNTIVIFTNSQELIETYSFRFIELRIFAPQINPDSRKIYPILELLNGDLCFWDAETPEQQSDLLQSAINRFNAEELQELIKSAQYNYPLEVFEKVNKLING